LTDDQAPTVFPANSLSAEQEGFFVVRADGSGLRRLGAASSDPPYGEPPGYIGYWNLLAFSPDSRMVTYTDRGPSLDNEDAVQIFTLDLISGDRRQITRLPPARPTIDPTILLPCGPAGCPYFNDDQTITFRTNANLDGTNPGGQNVSATVKIDGSGLTVSPPIAALPGSSLVTSFQITGSEAGAALLTLPGMAVSFFGGFFIREVFFIDGQNVLQLTHFSRAETWGAVPSPDGQRVFFSASANPLGTNPTENCQVFSINRHGGDLQQLTSFSENPHPRAVGCGWFEPPRGCTAFYLGFEPHTGALVFQSNCDPFGTNPYGGQVFAMRPDGSGLRQLTNTQAYTVDAAGTVSVEAAFPFAHPGTQH
jgi:hypothetical protein